jgi:hypothetical protein
MELNYLPPSDPSVWIAFPTLLWDAILLLAPLLVVLFIRATIYPVVPKAAASPAVRPMTSCCPRSKPISNPANL